MTKSAPVYFENIKNDARERWEQLEKYPDLAAPWHQLFSQIQSPRHVVSELLQNADDVEATWASITLENGNFIFQHNGLDFDENNLRSLCRFGYSNKRTLHTIGFRGIGFKSTFSLGPVVEVFSPSLAIYFNKGRFTEPVWIDYEFQPDDGTTTIRVKVENLGVADYITQNIKWWIETPVPLLFFKHIKKLSFNGQVISKEVLSDGPVAHSKWLSLVSCEKSHLLLINSREQDVPEEALNEIREERGDPNFIVPPCQVDLIVGLEKQQLYEILPTNVTVQLPFSANAPFIQDPARTGIKDPLNSPMNRWLLRCIGDLASSTLTEWLANKALSLEERAEAYSLLPAIREDYANSIIEACEKTIVDIFQSHIKDRSILITTRGSLASAQTCLNIDPDLVDVWTEKQIIELFGSAQDSIIAREVGFTSRKLLNQWDLLEQRTYAEILGRLIQTPLPPKPGVDGIKALWMYVNTHLPNWPDRYYHKMDLRIVPVKGKGVLYPANSVNVLSLKEKQLTDDEFAFLQDYLVVLDPAWLKYIQTIRDKLKKPNHTTNKSLLGINDLFSEFGLDQGITIESIFNQAAQAIFSKNDPGERGIRIAHIASRLGISIPQDFKYLCADDVWRNISEGILIPGEGFLNILYPEEILNVHLLSCKYELGLDQEESQGWKSWLQSEKSHLRRFLLPLKTEDHIYGNERVINFCKQRNGAPPSYYPRVKPNFCITDYDFPVELWQYWEESANSEPTAWVTLVYQIAQDWQNGWGAYCFARIQQETSGYYYPLDHGQIQATWLEKLKKLKCIPDTQSKPRLPIDLLRATPETSGLTQIEPFVEEDFDQPAFIQLLDLLGVRNKATDPSKIINRIQALSHASMDTAILPEIINLYNALDRVVLRMDSEQVTAIKEVFTAEKLLLSGDSTWHVADQIYQTNPDQIPGIPSIHPALANINLLERLDVPRRPSVDDAIHWLNHITGSVITGEDEKRIRAILQHFPERVWQECKHWLNLEGEWQICRDLHWGTQKLQQAKNMFNWVKEETADLSMLENPALIFNLGEIKQLDSELEYRLSNYKMSKLRPNPDWILALAEKLQHVKSGKDFKLGFPAQLDLLNISREGKRLSETRLMIVTPLDAMPYLGGQQVGYSSNVKALWDKFFLYVLDDQKNNHREIANAISNAFNDDPIKTAINDCISRDPEWIESYFFDYFELGESEVSDSSNQDKIKNETADLNDENFVDKPNGNQTSQQGKGDQGIDWGPKHKRKKSLRPEEKFSLFIQSHGFIWNQSKEIFLNEKGGRIILSRAIFPWIEYDNTGNEICCYRMEEGFLKDGLLIKAEVWDFIQQKPGLCCLVIDEGTRYRKVSGHDILQLLRQKRVQVLPAFYLIKQDRDSDPAPSEY